MISAQFRAANSAIEIAKDVVSQRVWLLFWRSVSLGLEPRLKVKAQMPNRITSEIKDSICIKPI